MELATVKKKVINFLMLTYRGFLLDSKPYQKYSIADQQQSYKDEVCFIKFFYSFMR